MTRTVIKAAIAACALSAANAFAFYGAEIENYKPNPWLDRPFPANKAPSPAREPPSATRGATQPAAEAARPASKAPPEASAASESETERVFREIDLRSRGSR
jgi:hypothetical protein